MKYVKAPRGFPTQITILGMRWRVLYSPDLLEREDNYGTTHYRRAEIAIDCTVDAQTMRRTLVHEVIHACLHANDSVAQMTQEGEERIVRSLMAPLMSALLDNAPWWR